MTEMFPCCTLLFSPRCCVVGFVFFFLFAIINNPIVNISMQRTFCFFLIIYLETEFLETEILVKGEEHFRPLLHLPIVF